MDVHPTSGMTTACGYAEGGIGLWDLRRGRIPSSLVYAHSDEVSQVAWHPKRHNILLTGSEDGQVCALDVKQQDEDDAVEWCGNVGNTVRRIGVFGDLGEYDSNIEVYIY